LLLARGLEPSPDLFGPVRCGRRFPKLSTRESIFFDEVHDRLSLPPSQPTMSTLSPISSAAGSITGPNLSWRRPKDVGQVLGHCGRRTATNLLFSWGQFGGLRRLLSRCRFLSGPISEICSFLRLAGDHRLRAGARFAAPGRSA